MKLKRSGAFAATLWYRPEKYGLWITMLPEEPEAERENSEKLNNVFADSHRCDQEVLVAAIRETSGY
jgi:hypothetical protein